MKRIVLISLAITLAVSAMVSAQTRKPPRLPKFNRNKEKQVFLRKQWFLGFKAGVNASGAEVIKSYSVMHAVNYEESWLAKDYRPYADVGTQATLEATFYFSGLSVSFQPTYRHNRFAYTNQFTWADGEMPNNRLDLRYEQMQNLDYFDLPFLARYERMFNQFSPYVQAGAYYALLLDASKSVTMTGVDHASGGTGEFTTGTIIVGASDLYAKRHWGLVGGVGVFYTPGNVRFNLDARYLHGMSNITSTKNRFGNDRLSGIGDTLDDMKLRSFFISAGCLFPLRFIGKDFRSVENSK